MNTKLITLLFLASTRVGSAAEFSLSGDWSVSSEIAGNQSTVAITFKQEGNNLTGVVKTRAKELPVTGAVSGRKIEWHYTTEWQSNALTLVYLGSCEDAGKLSGTVEVRPMDVEGSFSAVKKSHP